MPDETSTGVAKPDMKDFTFMERLRFLMSKENIVAPDDYNR